MLFALKNIRKEMFRLLISIMLISRTNRDRTRYSVFVILQRTQTICYICKICAYTYSTCCITSQLLLFC